MKSTLCRALTAVSLGFAGPAAASEPQKGELLEAFVEANILAVFYHELGHAVIDIEEVPIFGQEEDAADVFSTFLIHTLYEDDTAQDIAFDTAMGFLGEAEFALHSRREEAWWGVHGPNQQRFFNTVCLFYGASPDTRAWFAEEMELPEGRAATCEAEFAQAERSWGAVFDELVAQSGGESLVFIGETEGTAGELLAYEVEELNAVLQLSAPLEVTVESCGLANAFYAPSERRVIFCSEFETYFREMARWMF
ncbi:MAG: DUF4344 domain-containing metallopeptidase [Roseovarius sp.]